jgi:hypothetical protein
MFGSFPDDKIRVQSEVLWPLLVFVEWPTVEETAEIPKSLA